MHVQPSLWWFCKKEQQICVWYCCWHAHGEVVFCHLYRCMAPRSTSISCYTSTENIHFRKKKSHFSFHSYLSASDYLIYAFFIIDKRQGLLPQIVWKPNPKKITRKKTDQNRTSEPAGLPYLRKMCGKFPCVIPDFFPHIFLCSFPSFRCLWNFVNNKCLISI